MSDPITQTTTFRMRAEDEAILRALKQHLGDVPTSSLLREGLKALAAKHGIKLTKSKR